MARGGDDGSGSGCLLLIILAFVIGGGFWKGIGLLAAGWFAYLVLIGISIGIVVVIVKAIAGE
jgi:hypothetical protein